MEKMEKLQKLQEQRAKIKDEENNMDNGTEDEISIGKSLGKVPKMHTLMRKGTS